MGFIAAVRKRLFSKLKDVDIASFTALTPIPSWDNVNKRLVGVALPNGIASGTAVGQIARWDGTAWKPTGNIKVASDGKVSFLDNAGHELLRFDPASSGLQLLHSFFDGGVGTSITGDGTITTGSISASSLNCGQYGAAAVGQFGAFHFKLGSVVTSSLIEASPGVLRVMAQGGGSGGVLASALYIDTASVTPANAGNIGTIVAKAPVLNEYKNPLGYVAIYN